MKYVDKLWGYGSAEAFFLSYSLANLVTTSTDILNFDGS
jgi:hypothetical protein